MIKNLVLVSDDEIKESAEHSINSSEPHIMYFHNNGTGEYWLTMDDLKAYIYEDIDE